MKNKQPVPVLIPFLILVSMLFIGILIFAYVETKKANPKMIEVGRTPWSARVPLDPLLAGLVTNPAEADGGVAADQGVRPTIPHDLHAVRLDSGDARLLLRRLRERLRHPARKRRGGIAARISATPNFSSRASDWD